MAAINVRILSREFIKPSTPTPHTQSEIKFSGLDQIFGATRFPMVFFFQNNQPSSEMDSTGKLSLQLKESLSLALTKFYPFAGRMNEDSSSLICNDNGVLYLEAQVDANLTDSTTIHNGHYIPTDENNLPLAIQLNFFACGGTAIGINFSHWISDAWTFAMFLNHWAGICRRGAAGEGETLKFGLGHELFPPRINRETTLFKAEETLSKKIVSKRFLFNKEKIASLKKLAPTQNPSRVEVVLAFLMKQIIQMNRSKANPKSKVVARIAVNLRQRFGPPVDNSTMGNFVISTLVPFTSHTKLDFEVLVDGFVKATSALKSIDLGFDCVKYCSEIFTEIKDPDMWSCLMSSLCGFPMYDVDFGWGKPLLICPVVTKPAILFGNAKYGNGIEVWMNLFEEDMKMVSKELLSLESPCEVPFAISRRSRM